MTKYRLRHAFWSLLLVACTVASARGASLCTDCHGIPPIDAAYRNVTTGGFRGSHQTHSAASAAACAICHQGSATFTTSHRDGVIQLSANINSSPVPALYSKGVFFNQTSIPVMGTCSNTNCHFEATTPVWAGTPFVSPASCGSCHGASPADGNHPALSGPGKKHGDYYGTGTASCVKCHPDYTVAAKPFAHATSAGKRGLLLRFTAAPNTTGTYSKSANLAYPAYLPSQTTAANRNGSCSSMYCHSNGTGGIPRTTPVWGGTLPADCSGCHGGNSASAGAIASGAHAAHVNNAAVIGSNIGCAACHSTTVSGDLTVSTVANHVNGAKNVSFSGGGTYAAATLTCSATVCHAAGKATATQPTAPTWTGAAMGCNGCHGRSTTTGAPDYTNGGAAVALANSHAKHVASAADCDACHTTTTTSGTAIKAGSTVHANGAINVAFNTAKAGASATWTASTKTCANTYCHGATLAGGTTKSPVWGATLTGCGTCHGYPPATTSGVHTGVTATQCINCHTNVNATGTGFTDPTKHANGTLDVAGGHAVPFYAHTTPPFTSCTGCHNTSAVGTYPATAGAAPNCRGCHTLADPTVTATGCTSCHGNPPTGTTRPNIAGSHAKHATIAGVTAACSICHSGAGTGSGAAHGPGNKGTNPAVDNIVFTAAQAGASATWAAATKTCSTTYCHGATLTGGTTKNPVWGTTLTGCGTCHGFPPATATHTGVTATQCVNCHTHVNATGTGFTDATKHINGTIDAASGDCTTCHNAQQGVGTRRVVGTDTVLASRHITTATANQASCQVCHQQTTFGHMVAGDVAVGIYNQDTGAALTYDGTTATAANLEASCNSCHDSNGASRLGANAMRPFTASGDNTAPQFIGWSTGRQAHGANMACFNCHGNSAGSAGNTLTPKYNAHGSATADMLQYTYNTANDTMTMAANFCYNCHGTTIANGVTSPSIQAAVSLSASIGHKSAKCADCHDHHSAKPGNHAVAPSAPMAPVLNGVAGRGGWPATSPTMATTWNGTGTLAVTYTAKPKATKEYEICFKCHAGSVLAPTGYTSGALRMTDLGLEFNPNNKSGHPVVASLNNYGGSATPKALLAGDMVAPWTAIGTQTMTCSDCHGAAGTGAKGPHGSSVRWMLTGANQAWPFTTTAGNGTATGTPWMLGNYNTGTAPNKLFCLNCHTVGATNGIHDGVMSGGKHSSWASTNRGACLSCHIRVPHGAKTSRLLRLGTAAVTGRYAPNGNGAEAGTTTTQVLSRYTKGTQTSNRRGAFTGVGCSEHAGGTETW